MDNIMNKGFTKNFDIIVNGKSLIKRDYQHSAVDPKTFEEYYAVEIDDIEVEKIVTLECNRIEHEMNSLPIVFRDDLKNLLVGSLHDFVYAMLSNAEKGSDEKLRYCYTITLPTQRDENLYAEIVDAETKEPIELWGGEHRFRVTCNKVLYESLHYTIVDTLGKEHKIMVRSIDNNLDTPYEVDILTHSFILKDKRGNYDKVIRFVSFETETDKWFVYDLKEKEDDE